MTTTNPTFECGRCRGSHTVVRGDFLLLAAVQRLNGNDAAAARTLESPPLVECPICGPSNQLPLFAGIVVSEAPPRELDSVA